MSGYFFYHSIGTFAGKQQQMSAALDRFSRMWADDNNAQWPQALAMRQEFLDLWSSLIEAPAASMTTSENVTTALYSLMGALPDQYLRNRRVLIAADCFPSMHFLLVGMAARFGFTLETVPMRSGENWVRDEDFLQHWQADVGLALLTFVSSTSSHKVDVSRLAAHGRKMGSLVVADITQGVGIVPFSVAESGVDFAISTTLKWLCGVPGAGVLYARPQILAECAPELRGWFSQDNPFSWDLDKFSFAPDVRRFDHGTPSVLPCIACLPGLTWAREQGLEQLRADNLAKVHRLIGHAQAGHWTLGSPLDDAQRGGSLMIQLPDTSAPAQVLKALVDRQLYADTRGQTLRLSPGAVTSFEAIDLLAETLNQTVRWR